MFGRGLKVYAVSATTAQSRLIVSSLFFKHHYVWSWLRGVGYIDRGINRAVTKQSGNPGNQPATISWMVILGQATSHRDGK